MARVAISVVAVALVLALVATGLVIWSVRRAFPEYGGSLSLPGLGAPVTVLRDAHGIPQLYAHTEEDLFRAQGYAHAQERFWEMDFRRHVTAGRLAELFGPSQLETDTYIRTLGWRRVAEQEWALISPDSRRYLTAYADGVNAYLVAQGVLADPAAADGAPSGSVSLEYTLLGLLNRGHRIERWEPVDSLAWLKAMAWDLRGNMSSELDRANLYGQGLSLAQIDQLYPTYPYERNRTIVPASGGTGGTGGGVPAEPAGDRPPYPASTAAVAAPALAAARNLAAGLPNLLGPDGEGIGSNSFVLAGSRTTTGAPILANDPHLGPSLPGIWMQMGLHCDCGYAAAGYTFSGMPGVVIGHNDRLAWGFTNLDPDVTDLYLERVDGDRYLVDGAWRPLRERTETIRVAGATPVTITVRETGHGPLLSDASEPLRAIAATPPPTEPAGRAPADQAGAGPSPTGGAGPAPAAAAPTGPVTAVALRWTALDPGRTMDAVFAINRATDPATLRQAAALFEVPAQNIVYATVDGRIGYQAPGRIPVRGAGDGRWPAPGWDSRYDWRGFIPFAELPAVSDPPDGAIVTANQAVVGPAYPGLLTMDWTAGYRSQRINELLAAAPKHSVQDVSRIQFDSRNPVAADLVPELLAAPLDGPAVEARDLLRDWDGQQPDTGPDGSAQAHSSAAAAYFNAVWRHLLLRTFDEVPAGSPPDGGERWFQIVTGLAPNSPWWDDRSTPAVEDRTAMLTAALRDGYAELADRLGDHPAKWRWGDLHTLTLRNQSYGSSGIGPVEWLFNAGPYRTSGGKGLVNATGWNAGQGYEVNWVPSMRMIVDLGDLDRSRWVDLAGVSGHAFGPHYTDQVPLWRTGATLPMPWNRPAVEAAAKHRQTLVP
ncbi:penicillin acylase family protein [Plantactinospora sp. KBS50]|nr:penicillin acylase family protein [Plantactinospora sp. KBS50]